MTRRAFIGSSATLAAMGLFGAEGAADAGYSTTRSPLRLSRFCDEMDRLYRLKYPERNLQRIRRRVNLSQRELSERSGVSVRTIQELEQGRKDINRAGIDTLMPLAAAPSVDVESLVERVV